MWWYIVIIVLHYCQKDMELIKHRQRKAISKHQAAQTLVTRLALGNTLP